MDSVALADAVSATTAMVGAALVEGSFIWRTF